MNGEQMDNVARIVSALNACERIGWGTIEIGGSLTIAAEGRIERRSDRMRREMTEDEWRESAEKARADLDAIFEREREERRAASPGPKEEKS